MRKVMSTIVVVISVLFTLFILTGTGLFVYPFLSDAYSLHLYTLVLLVLLLLGLVFREVGAKGNYPSLQLVIFAGWPVYLALYSFFTGRYEAYFVTYLLAFFLVSFSLIYFLKNNLLQSTFLYIPLAFVGVSESVVSLLQYLHVLSSHSSFFTVTGTMDNPNIAAMVITLSIPSCIEVLRLLKKSYRYIGVIVSGIIMASLIVLQCRSALIGTGIIALVYLVANYGVTLSKLKGMHKILIASGVGCLIVFSVYLHQAKQASADSRLTIWKVSGEMIAKRPFAGYGYGLFQREYNLQQADYFNRKSRPEAERMNAGYTAMAYNEYLEQTVMGGIAGGLFFTAVLIALLWSGWRDRDKLQASLSGVAAFAVMSLINFTVQSPLIFFAFIIYAALILAQGKPIMPERVYAYPRKLAVLCCIGAIAFIAISLQKYSAQKQLKIARELFQPKKYRIAESIINEIEPEISTSEEFYYTKAVLLVQEQQYDKAKVAIGQALQYTSSPSLLLMSARLSEKQGDYATAERDYLLICGIEPHLFRPRAQLMRMYAEVGNIAKSKEIARDILLLKPKVKSKEVIRFKYEAKEMLLGKASSHALNR